MPGFHFRRSRGILRPDLTMEETPDRTSALTTNTLAERLRQAARLTGFFLWTAVCYLAWAPGALATIASRRAFQAWNGRIQRTWTRGILAVLGVEVNVRGLPPRPPFFLVSNHLSYLDIIVLGSRLGSTFVSKAELGGWPLLGHLARITGTIFIDRGRRRDALRVIREIDGVIGRGGGIIVFPEATSSRGDRIYPLRTALLEWAAVRSFPVHAATVRYETHDRDPPAFQSVCWWGEMTFTPHVMGLLGLRRVRATVTFASEPAVEDQRGRLGARLHGLLEQHFEPVAQEEGA